MALASFVQTEFFFGEWSQSAQGNLTDPAYKKAMATCLNSFPTETGAWTRRPGFMHGAMTRNGGAGRVIKFDFQENEPYTLEFTDGFLRFHSGTSLVMGTDSQSVTAISSASPAVVTTGGTHGWSTGSQFMFTALGTPDPLLSNRQFIGTVTDVNKLSLVDSVTGLALNGAALLTFTTGTLSRIIEIRTPYSSAVLPSLRSVQAQTQAILLQKTIAPNVLLATVEPSGTTPATFSMNPASFSDGPYLDPIRGMLVTPASLSGLVGISFSFQTWSSSGVYAVGDYVTYSGSTYRSLVPQNLNNQPNTATSAWVAVIATEPIGPNGLQSTDIGRHVRIFSEPPDWNVSTTYGSGGTNVVKFNRAYFVSLAGSNTGNPPGVDPTKWALYPAGAIWSWGKITSLSGSTTSLIDRTAGSIIGDLVSDIANAFDGVTSQVQNSCARTGGSSPTHYIGKNFSSSPQKLSYCLVYSASDSGIIASGSHVTLNLRGSQTLPSSSSNGTLLGSTGNISNFLTGPVEIGSSDTTTTWNYLWVEIAGYDLSNTIAVAEVQFYQSVATAGTGMTVQLYGPPLLYTTAASTWRLGAFSDTTGYPACGTFHEGRLWLSGAINNRLDASALIDINGNPVGDDLFTFSPTISDGSVTEANAISYMLTAPDVNAVFWMQPHQQGIVVGTQAGEWLVQASALNSPLTPINMQAHRVTKIGCANIEPQQTEHTIVFVQRHRHKVMEYFSDVFSGKFSAPNLSKNARHLATRGIAEIAYQQELVPIIWARCDDGSLIGASYKRETLMSSQGPTFIGWHRHTIGTDYVVESIAVGPSQANGQSGAGEFQTLALIASDDGVRHVEFMDTIFEEGSDITTARFLDSAVVAAGYSTGTISSGVPGMTAVGFWHLSGEPDDPTEIGEQVTVFAGGLDLGEWPVVSGKIEIPFSKNPLFTAAFVAGFSGTMPITAGFTYTSRGQLLRPDTVPESGARTGPGFGKVRRIHRFAADLVDTQGISVGTTSTRLRKYPLKTAGGSAQLADNVLFTGIMKDTFDGNAQSLTEQIMWEISRPFPATVNSMGAFIETQDE